MNPHDADPLLGHLVEGRYRVRAHVADGGMGSVYVAHDERLQRDVALKVLRRDLSRDPSFVHRFEREARAAARLSHPHVVAVHDQGHDAGLVFLAMEYVQGSTLRDVIRTGGRSVAEMLGLFEQIADGLAAAHAAGFVHRDIKPENVLITTAGFVKIADFGLARAVSSSGVTADSEVLIGTASYLAPEQVEPASFSASGARSDVYSAGLLLFEMLTGRRAYDGELPLQVAYQHVHAPMPSAHALAPALTPEVDALFTAVCAKDPAHRPADAAGLLHEVRRLRGRLPETTLAHRVPPGVASSQERGTTRGTTGTFVGGDAPQRTSVMRTPPEAVPPASLPVGEASPVPASGPTQQAHMPPTPPSPSDTRPLRADATTAFASGAHPLTPVRRRRRAPLIVAAALVVAIIAVALAFTLGPLRSSTVPDVHGRPQGEAVSALRHAGFDVRLTSADSDDVPAGEAVGTDPSHGSVRRRGVDVTLAISHGPRMVDVPDVAGKPEGQARTLLTRAGLRPGPVSTKADVTAAGTILSTTPGRGASVRHDTGVALVISSGPAEVEIPDIEGTSGDDARRQLEQLGLNVATRQDYDDDTPSGDVISVSPDVGASARTGDHVTVVISKGQQMVDVPDVTGMRADEAKQRLEDAGFHVQGDSWVDDVLNSKVSSQDPAGGTGQQAPKGSDVTLSF